MTDNVQELIEKAINARDRAYAPYSNHPVGAAVLTTDGTIHTGCNVENAAYPLGICAEKGAISDMALKGHRRIEKVVVVGPGKHLCSPCGGCRQCLREFGADNSAVIICNDVGEIMLETTIGELLPHSFGPENIIEVKVK